MKTIVFQRLVVCVSIMLALSACAAMIKPIKSNNIDGLQVIHEAYRKTVHSAHNDSSQSWNNGRLGNIIVNINGGEHKGLCYHWQKLVYNGIQPALVKTGWEATGIAINEGSFFEHHAVLVYDPGIIGPNEILEEPYKSNSYVLDPWSSGEPRIYTTADWLKLPLTIKKPARLTRIKSSASKTGSL